MLKVKPSQRGSYYYLHSYLLLLCTCICANRWPKNARGSLSSYGEKLCLINFDQGTKVIYPKYSRLIIKRGGLNKRVGLAEYILLEEPFYYVKYVSSIITSKILSKVLSDENKKLVFPEK